MAALSDGQWKAVFWRTYLDVWKLVKNHWDEKEPDWERIHRDAREVRAKHPTRVCEELLLAALNELERREKQLEG